jgi:hypothetical protein
LRDGLRVRILQRVMLENVNQLVRLRAAALTGVAVPVGANTR